MTYKLMLIDDQIHVREPFYRKVFTSPEFELTIINSPSHLADIVGNTPVDAYVVDVFLDTGNWAEIQDAGKLFSKILSSPPRPSPVFLVSQLWGATEAIPVLNSVNRQSNVEVLRYLTWPEFERAAKDGPDNLELAALKRKILDDLSIWHEQSTFRPASDKSIRILLLADLQYGDPHTSPSAVFDEQWIVRALNRDKLTPDLVVMAGDIAYSGAPHEYLLAKSKIEENLLRYMWGDVAEKMRERILMVPGNHDVNLRFSACSLYDWKRDEKKWEPRNNEVSNNRELHHATTSHVHDYALEPFRKFAQEITGSRSWESLSASSRVDRRFEHLGIRFYLFNSVSGITTEKPTHADFNATTLGKITCSLGSADRPKDFFNIAVSHHGIQTGNPDSIQMADWKNVGKQFYEFHNIGLWMFGHYHKADFNPIHQNKLGLLEAPTLKIRPGEGVNRGFTLIELSRSAGKVSGIDVYFYQLGENGVVETEKPRPRHQDVTS